MSHASAGGAEVGLGGTRELPAQREQHNDASTAIGSAELQMATAVLQTSRTGCERAWPASVITLNSISVITLTLSKKARQYGELYVQVAQGGS